MSYLQGRVRESRQSKELKLSPLLECSIPIQMNSFNRHMLALKAINTAVVSVASFSGTCSNVISASLDAN